LTNRGPTMSPVGSYSPLRSEIIISLAMLVKGIR